MNKAHEYIINGKTHAQTAAALAARMKADARAVGYDSISIPSVFSSIGNTNSVSTRYYYHSDHLGSSSFVTNSSGAPIQELRYMPYGEILKEKRVTTFTSSSNPSFSTPYRFSAKEKDLETGFSYFGQRYYADWLGVWLSVDPMSDERPWISPYNYCQWNPLSKVDPNGALDWHPGSNGQLIADKGDNEFTLTNYIYNKTGNIVSYGNSRAMIETMYRGEPIKDIAGHGINLGDVKNIAGSHVATMLNPATSSVHNAQNSFINSDPIQAISNILSFTVPASGILKSIKAASKTSSVISHMGLGSSVFGNIYSIGKATDNTFGMNSFSQNSIPGEVLSKIGYPNMANAVDKAVSGRNMVKNVVGGNFNVSKGVFDTDIILKESPTIRNQKNEDTGY